MSKVTTFKFNKRPVRIVEKDGCKFFVIRDICDILGFSNPNRQLAIHTGNTPLYERINTPGGPQVVRLVPREDVEKILTPNRGRKAAALRRWLRKEVYPKVFPDDDAKAAEALVCAFLEVMEFLMTIPLELQPMLFLDDFDTPRRKTKNENR